MHTDALLYRLLQARPALLLELAGLVDGLADGLTDTGTGYRFSAIEVKQTAFRLDGVLLPPDTEPHAPVFFVENQFQDNTNSIRAGAPRSC